MTEAINTLISIPADDIYGSSIEFGKGEIVYFSNQKLGAHIFNKILQGQLILAGNSAVSLSNIRKNIAYISDNNYLWEKQSAKQNVELYLKSIRLSTNSHQEYISQLNIDWNQNVEDLDTLQRHLLQIAIGLSKDPEIILYENSTVIQSESVYNHIMSTIYDLVKNKGITFLSNLSSTHLNENYPGRTIE